MFCARPKQNTEHCFGPSLAWLSCVPVQDLLRQICEEALCHSLAAERRHNEAKQWEASKVTHIATASRNLICMRFAKEREANALALADAVRRLHKAEWLNPRCLSWRETEMRPEGARYSEEGWAVKKGLSVPCRVEASAAPGAGLERTLPRGSSSGPKRTLSAREVDELIADRDALVLAARAKVQALMSSFDTPITRPQWAAWLEDNLGEFQARMQAAPPATSLEEHTAAGAAGFTSARATYPATGDHCGIQNGVGGELGRAHWVARHPDRHREDDVLPRAPRPQDFLHRLGAQPCGARCPELRAHVRLRLGDVIGLTNEDAISAFGQDSLWRGEVLQELGWAASDLLAPRELAFRSAAAAATAAAGVAWRFSYA